MSGKSLSDHRPERRRTDPDAARPLAPLVEGASFDQLKDRVDAVGDRAEALVDEALEETFPASDPISPSGVN